LRAPGCNRHAAARPGRDLDVIRKQQIEHVDPPLDQPGVDVTAIDGLDDSGGARDLPHPVVDRLESIEGVLQTIDRLELVDRDQRYTSQ
jgi:hypothetical protein